jgi:hypothetical protein
MTMRFPISYYSLKSSQMFYNFHPLLQRSIRCDLQMWLCVAAWMLDGWVRWVEDRDYFAGHTSRSSKKEQRQQQQQRGARARARAPRFRDSSTENQTGSFCADSVSSHYCTVFIFHFPLLATFIS